jgi:hypothetical protein
LFELFSKPWDQEAFFEARAYFFNYTSFWSDNFEFSTSPSSNSLSYSFSSSNPLYLTSKFHYTFSNPSILLFNACNYFFTTILMPLLPIFMNSRIMRSFSSYLILLLAQLSLPKLPNLLLCQIAQLMVHWTQFIDILYSIDLFTMVFNDED